MEIKTETLVKVTKKICDYCPEDKITQEHIWRKCVKCGADICTGHSTKGIIIYDGLGYCEDQYEDDILKSESGKRDLCTNCFDSSLLDRYEKGVMDLVNKFNQDLKELNNSLGLKW